MKHYSTVEDSSASALSLYFEVRLDIQDVRSGYRTTIQNAYSAPPVAERELDWTIDMVRPVNSVRLREIPAQSQASWPEGTDERIQRFFARTYRVPIWRNPELGLYSRPGESRAEFIERCAEGLGDERRKRVQAIVDIFLRRFLELEQRTLSALEDDEDWVGEAADRRLGEIRAVFSNIRERLSTRLLVGPGRDLTDADLRWTSSLDVESLERLETIRDEFLSQLNHTRGVIRHRAAQLEIYEVPVSHGQVDIISRGFLWH